MNHEARMKEPLTIVKAVLLIAPSLLLIYKQPNLSNTLCIAALFCILMYIGGLSYKFIATALAIAIPAAIIVVSIAVMPNQPIFGKISAKTYSCLAGTGKSMQMTPPISNRTLLWRLVQDS